jgi:hypothetical protein
MAKKPTPYAGQTEPTSPPAGSYAYKPLKIGPLLKARAKEKGYNARYIGAKLGIYHRNVHREYKRVSMSMKQLLKWSEILDQNFLLLYHPNVKPLPNPLQSELDKQKGYVQDRDELENEVGILKNRILRLEGKLEGYEEREAKRNGR